ncbi:hypothetical protein BJY04DRAFT_213502 [Aspergillus karnatakaensis]|uniref:uncharacterized protein n=1 Tax=Aspergillus karnatakaensis TaxID=1810916 RepID=UPI003CCE3B3D
MDSTILTVAGWTQFLAHAKYVLESEYAQNEGLAVGLPFSAWQDELGRLRVWEKDFGAAQNQYDQTSLRDRLERYPLVSNPITRQLARIERLFRDLELLFHRSEEQEPSMLTDSDEEVEDDEPRDMDVRGSPLTVVQKIYMHFEDSITGLNRMSAILVQRENNEPRSEMETRTETMQETKMQPARPQGPSSREKPSRAAYANVSGEDESITLWTCVSVRPSAHRPHTYVGALSLKLSITSSATRRTPTELHLSRYLRYHEKPVIEGLHAAHRVVECW